MKYIAGFDIGGTKCAVLLARLDKGLEILERRELATREIPDPRQAVDKMAELAGQMAAAHGAVKLSALGISCGGPLDVRRGVIQSPPHLPGWDDIPVNAWLEEALSAPAFLQNDANACALVEWRLGAGRGARDMIFCTMGTGFGAGIIAEGVLLNGTAGLSGEIGHVRLEPDGPVSYGKAGSVEAYCSGDGIAALAALHTEQCLCAGYTPQWTRDGYAPEQVDARLAAQYAHQGDADGLEVYQQAGDKLGRTLAVLLDILNPELVVIGSIFARAEGLLRPAMEAALAREALPGAVRSCRVVPAQTGDRLGDYASLMVACHGMGFAL